MPTASIEKEKTKSSGKKQVETQVMKKPQAEKPVFSMEDFPPLGAPQPSKRRYIIIIMYW